MLDLLWMVSGGCISMSLWVIRKEPRISSPVSGVMLVVILVLGIVVSVIHVFLGILGSVFGWEPWVIVVHIGVGVLGVILCIAGIIGVVRGWGGGAEGRGEWRGREEGGRIAAEVTTPEGYRQRISALGLDDVQIGINTVAEAKAALTTARGMEKQLRQVRQDINEDMVAIRAHYAVEESKAGEVKEVRAERDWKLAPYNDVKVYIHDLLMQAIGAHVQATQFMEDEKAKQQAEMAKQQAEKAVVRKADSSAVYCPACGKRVAKADAFCGHCGAGL